MAMAGGVTPCGKTSSNILAIRADLSFAPRPSDQVVIGGKTYQVVSVNPRSPFSEAAIHIVQVRGGHG
jgi:hypothetical protein